MDDLDGFRHDGLFAVRSNILPACEWPQNLYVAPSVKEEHLEMY